MKTIVGALTTDPDREVTSLPRLVMRLTADLGSSHGALDKSLRLLQQQLADLRSSSELGVVRF
jgi:hypothetical protein